MSNPVTANLAKNVAAYFQELQGRNLSSELAEQLTRDYQQARIAALYGITHDDNLTPAHVAALCQIVREALGTRGAAGQVSP